MTTSKESILASIRAANGPADGAASWAAGAAAAAASAGGGPDDRRERADADAAYANLSREYLRAHHDPAAGGIAALFAERAADYRAVVEQVLEPGLPAAIAKVLAERAAAAPGPFVMPAGLPPGWLTELPPGLELAATPRRSRRPNSTGWPGS